MFDAKGPPLYFEKVGFWVPFWTPVDFEGGPKIAFSAIMLEKSEKRGSRSGSGKNMKFRRVFDAKMGGPEMVKRSSRPMLVAI